MTAPGLFMLVVIGLLTGLVGRWIVRGRQSRFGSLIGGVAGAIVGVAVSEALGYPVRGVGPLLLTALAGATALLACWSLLARR